MRGIALALLLASGGAAVAATAPVFDALTVGGAPVNGVVASNTALKAYAGVAGQTVFRSGYATAGDGGAMTYTFSASTCLLAGGNGDNGSEVRPASGPGCWIANFAAQHNPTPQVWGAVGNGTENDTAPVQAAIDAAGRVGFVLAFDQRHFYNVPGGLTMTTPAKLEGPFRYGAWTTLGTTSGTQACTWGLTNTTFGTTTMLNISAVTATVKGICIDMTGGNRAANPTSGAAIKLAPVDIVHYQSGIIIEDNTIFSPYDGITMDGAGPTTVCCGAGSTTNGVRIAGNTIISPGNTGISIGKNSIAATTVGITVTDNVINCNAVSPASRANGVGLAIYDGAVWYDGTQNGPEGCNIGVKIAPGRVGATGLQIVQFDGDGTFGDQSLTHDLLIQPQDGGSILFINIGGKSPWAAATSNVNSVLIDCSASVNISCAELNFNGFIAHNGANQTKPTVHIIGGFGGPYDLTIIGSSFCSFGGPAAGNDPPVLKLDIPVTANNSGRWSIIGNRFGGACVGAGSTSMKTGIELTIDQTNAPVGAVLITNNDFSLNETPIKYTPKAEHHVIINNNMGIDDQCPVIASAATMTLPNAYNCYQVGGTATVQSMPAPWANRIVRLVSLSGFATSFVPGPSPICASGPVAIGTTKVFTWQTGGTCWSSGG